MKPGSGEQHRLEHWVHRSLLAGLLASGVLLAAGLAAAAAKEQPGPPENPRPIALLVTDALRGEGEALMTLGLLVLMATPVARVGVLAVGWAVEGERRLAAVAAAVLALLAVSLYLGMG
jgi:hypothetical protein